MKTEKQEEICNGERFVKCMFENRDLDCNRSKCPLSKNKTNDVQKRIKKIINKIENEKYKKVKKLKEKVENKGAKFGGYSIGIWQTKKVNEIIDEIFGEDGKQDE